MDNLLPLTDAINRYHISDHELHQLIETGKIRVMNYGPTEFISEDQLKMNLPKHNRADYRQFEHLKGVGIHLSAAERKYGIPNQTLYRWAKAGYIAKIGKDGQKVILDEADVAYCAYIYKHNKGSQGKWIFSPGGIPYIPKGK